MREVTDEKVKEVVDRCFGRHADPETNAKALPLKDIAKVLIIAWEARYPFPNYD